MSHFTRVRTEIRDRDLLVRALGELDFRVEEDVGVRGYQGTTDACELVVRHESGYDIGFTRKSEDTPYELLADWDLCPMDEEVFRQRVRQEYAAQAAERSVRAQGYKNVERRRDEQTGEIKLVVTA